MHTLSLQSPAKINLHLRVAAPDASGFHPLRSWMVRVGLHDTLRFERRDSGDITLTCDEPTLPTDRTNLVVRAAEAIAPGASVAIHLSKSIPAGAGLGGGSGNAATTLIGLDRLLGLHRPTADLHALAATLGSDVPFFLGTPSAVATGRGERISPAPVPALARFALLIFPPFGISTPAAYRELDRLRPFARADTLAEFPVDAWATLAASELLGRLVNDLESPAFSLEPRLSEMRADCEQRLGRTVRMSGSGSTLFTLYDSPDEADAGASIVRANGLKSGVASVG